MNEQSNLTAAELREMRNDMQLRYRENQLREGWRNQDSAEKTSYVTQEDRNFYEQMGKTQLRIENHNSREPTYVHYYSDEKKDDNENEGSIWDLFAFIGVIWVIYMFISFVGKYI